MVTLWRIQARTDPKRGCFEGGADGPAGKARAFGFRDGEHPTPSEEGYGMSPSQFCAFPTLKEFRQWFRTKAQRQAVLKHRDFTLVRLTVTKAVILQRQALFEWEHVTDVRIFT